MNLGNKIKELRNKKGISQKELGEILGVDQRTVSVWEQNKFEPSDEMKKKLCDYFNIKISELFGEEPTVIEKPVKDEVSKLMERLLEEKIITDPDNIPEPVAKLILDAVRMDLRLKQLRK